MSPGKFPAKTQVIWVPPAACNHASSAPVPPQLVCLQGPSDVDSLPSAPPQQCTNCQGGSEPLPRGQGTGRRGHGTATPATVPWLCPKQASWEGCLQPIAC